MSYDDKVKVVEVGPLNRFRGILKCCFELDVVTWTTLIGGLC